MKKFISVLMIATMVGSLMAGCSAKKAAVSEETVGAETEVEAPQVDEEPLTMGFIFLHDENSTYDRNFMEGAKAACEAKGVNYLEKVGIPEGNECYEAAADLVDRGADIVFADSFGHENFLLQAAQEFSDVQFAHATGTNAHTSETVNFHNAFAHIYEGRYLGGVAAGMKLNEMIEAGLIKPEEAKVGYVGAFTYAEVISGLTSFFLGVRSVCPSATMQVQFTGSWYDEALEKEAAQTLINNGCVIMSQHADSMGAPTACEEAGIPDVSYNGSTIDSCPNTFIVSSRINWQPYFEYLIDCVTNGEEIPADWCGTIATDSVVLTEINEAVAAKGTKEAIEEAKAKMISGELHVFDTDTFTVNGKKLNSYMADVDADANYEKDTEVISDSYFHESVYRSAPYFDIQIDGINFLNAMY